MKEFDGNAEISSSSRRWLIILVFSCYSLTSAFQWIEFAILPGIFTEYYGISSNYVTWTSTIYMATFIPLVFPATWLVDNTGLKNIALIGSGMNALGALIKCLALGPDSFWICFIGQTIAACAQCLILELPPKIASIWFPANQVSTATSLGVFGNQLGVALGFCIPPLIVTGPVTVFNSIFVDPKNENSTTFSGGYPADWSNEASWSANTTSSAKAEVADQLRILYYGLGAVTFLLFVLVFFTFEDKPKKFANRASLRRSEIKTDELNQEGVLDSFKLYGQSLLRLMKDKAFVLLTLSYGLNVGVYYAISTLLNQIIKPTFSASIFDEQFLASLDTQIGFMGTMMVVAGLVGAILGGAVLDKFKKFKLTTLICYGLTLVFMVLFTMLVSQANIIWDFVFISALGFFMTGYLPIGFEFGAELTYPESEATSSGLLNCAAQFFGFSVTFLCQSLVNNPESGARNANLAMIGCLVFGLVLTMMIKEDLKRQSAEKNDETEKLRGEE